MLAGLFQPTQKFWKTWAVLVVVVLFVCLFVFLFVILDIQFHILKQNC